jgi:hypothetical protein
MSSLLSVLLSGGTMLSQLANAGLRWAIVAGIAIIIAFGIMAFVIKSKKPAELPESMRRDRNEERNGHSDS